jgi:hypothetical protein
MALVLDPGEQPVGDQPVQSLGQDVAAGAEAGLEVVEPLL